MDLTSKVAQAQEKFLQTLQHSKQAIDVEVNQAQHKLKENLQNLKNSTKNMDEEVTQAQRRLKTSSNSYFSRMRTKLLTVQGLASNAFRPIGASEASEPGAAPKDDEHNTTSEAKDEADDKDPPSFLERAKSTKWISSISATASSVAEAAAVAVNGENDEERTSEVSPLSRLLGVNGAKAKFFTNKSKLQWMPAIYEEPTKAETVTGLCDEIKKLDKEQLEKVLEFIQLQIQGNNSIAEDAEDTASEVSDELITEDEKTVKVVDPPTATPLSVVT